jgi:undecaprenyl-diphosphatase
LEQSAEEPVTERDRVKGILSPNRRGHALQILIALGVLLVTAIPIKRYGVSDPESDIFYGINGLPGFLNVPLQIVMQFGNYLIVPVLALVAAGVKRFRMALDILVAGTAAWVLAKLVKQIVIRGRPAELLNDVILRGPAATGHGYVSGHAATAAAIAAVVTPYLSRKAQIAVWVVAGLVAFARVYVGAHLPLDVLGGAAMGWAIGSLVHLLLGPPDPKPAEA